MEYTIQRVIQAMVSLIPITIPLYSSYAILENKIIVVLHYQTSEKSYFRIKLFEKDTNILYESNNVYKTCLLIHQIIIHTIIPYFIKYGKTG